MVESTIERHTWVRKKHSPSIVALFRVLYSPSTSRPSRMRAGPNALIRVPSRDQVGGVHTWGRSDATG